VLLLQVKVRVENLTQHELRLGPFSLQGPEGVAYELEDEWVVEQVEFRENARLAPAGRIDPLDSVAGWLNYTFRRRPQGGTPAYELIVRDEVKNEYVLMVPEKLPTRHG